MLLMATDRGKELVACLCAQAERAGVRIGMTVAHARSLLTGRKVQVAPYAPAEDAARLGRLGAWVTRFCPLVAVDAPDGLLLNIAGCAHLYGGEAAMAGRVAAALERFGLEVRIAVAPTFACARAAARYAERPVTVIDESDIRAALSGLPIAALHADARTCSALAGVGVARIGELLELSRAELAARFGSGLLRSIDVLLGHGAPPVMEFLPFAEPVEACKEFAGPTTCWEAVQGAVRELLTCLMTDIRKRSMGVCNLALKFRWVNADPTTLRLRLTHPARDEEHLWSLLRSRLERLNVGYGIEEIHLLADRTARVRHEQQELWPGLLMRQAAGHDAAWGCLCDQLIERLGAGAVMTARARETYLPEEAFFWQSCAWSGEEGARERSGAAVEKSAVYAALRPTRLFGRAEAARALLVTPDGPIVQVQWRGRTEAVRQSVGPERILVPWWRQQEEATKPRSHGATERGGTQGRIEDTEAGADEEGRDYYAVQGAAGTWLWMFRQRASGEWFVHGEWS